MNWDKYRDEMDSINFDSEFYSRTLSSLNDNKKPVRTVRPKKAVIITLVIAVIAALGITAMAVKPQLSTEDAVLECLMGITGPIGKFDPKMADALESGKAQVVEVNQSQTSNGRTITLLGYVTGKDLSQYYEDGFSDYDPNREYTYVIYSIANANGTDYTAWKDGELSRGHFLPAGLKITPVEGGEMLETIGGDAVGTFYDGVVYYSMRCDSINNYDGNVYFAVSVSDDPVPPWDFWYAQNDCTMPEDGPILPAHTGAMVVFKLPK